MTRILFNCDDFGKTHGVNIAILKAYREGVLRSASLMVTGDTFLEAVEIAQAHPTLKVGLHLALSDAKPALPIEQIPTLVQSDGHFHRDPATIGMRLAFCPKAKEQARAEIREQFHRFISTGLYPSHVDGHHHLHMHPFVFKECIHLAEKLGFPRIRIAQEFGSPLPPRRDYLSFGSKLIRHLVFLGLSANGRRMLTDSSVKFSNGVLGLWETSRMSEDYLLHAIPQLPHGEWEIYSHVGSDGAEEELPALLSPSLKQMLKDKEIDYE